ncbi:MAG: Gfo/Idh/MocA family oxidoreductase [Planctomycetes bacterium]|nr:Gfo/Idh/MocA family oxidoreductase [Planctomycetota bacterium]MCD7896272.1 Gfo/Idh/MocA family oxidoreductase [Planctomycetaceae bacterium]
MLRIGIIGLGFMGKMHFETYQSLPHAATVTAIADVDPRKRSGDWSAIGGNIATANVGRVDLAGIRTYEHADDLIADSNVDVVDITLPTYLHCEYALKALAAGKHTLCEKPMAATGHEADRMIDAARAAGRLLLIGQCIRFWPAYVKARELVTAGEYGRVVTARFQRYSTLPLWSWENWLRDPEKSGLAAMDLHIHDSDYIAHLFGMPKAVTSFGAGEDPHGFDHIITRYHYDDDILVTAEGAWEYAPGFPFSMTFAIHMGKASLDFAADGSLTLYPTGGEAEKVDIDPASGYRHEIQHFLDCIEKCTASNILTPESARDSVHLVAAEIESARSGRTVTLGS